VHYQRTKCFLAFGPDKRHNNIKDAVFDLGGGTFEFEGIEFEDIEHFRDSVALRRLKEAVNMVTMNKQNTANTSNL
jgi:hypothetical protein